MKKFSHSEKVSFMTVDFKNKVGSLAKGFKVLESFTHAFEALTLSEVCSRSGLDSGTVFRILNTLVDLGYIEKLEETKQFHLTLKVANLGFNAIGRSDIRDLALPILRSLAKRIGETVSFATLEGANMVYLERVRVGLARLGVDIRVGSVIPAYCSAIGQALLAFLPEEELEHVLNLEPDFHEVVPLDKDDIPVMEQLKSIKAKGYILKRSSFNSSLTVLALPVFDRDRYPIGAISVVVPSIRISEDELFIKAFDGMAETSEKLSKAINVSGSATSAI